MNAATRELMRRQLLEKIYDRMSDEERKTFVRLALRNKSNEEIMLALRRQSQTLESQSQMLQHIQRGQQTFGEDFLSNLAANATWDGLAWLARRLFRHI